MSPEQTKDRMNTKPHHKLGINWSALGSVLAVGCLLAAAAPSATADTPIKSTFSYTADAVLTDVCPFDVDFHTVASGTQTTYFDSSGAVTRLYIHQIEQDTFSANGKTLVGIPSWSMSKCFWTAAAT